MPRSASGNYTPPAGNPVVSGTTIASTWANPTVEDIGNELQDSLSRTGKGAMQAPLKNATGTAGAPSLTFNVEPQTGWYRAANGDIRFAVAGVDAFRVFNGQAEVWDAGDSAWYSTVTAKTAGAVVETVDLAASQTVVPFTSNVAGAALYLDGTSGDRGRLLLGTDYTYDAVANEITLSTDYPAGTKLSAVINDETDVAAAATAASASANAAAASESNAATSESNAATSASNAATSESNAAGSESAAATSESNAAGSESAVSDSASAASDSASAAATSESNAATSESNASDSEVAAALSESNAATSESNAAGSESAAAASESAAAGSAASAADDALSLDAAQAAFTALNAQAQEFLIQGIANKATLSADFANNQYKLYEGPVLSLQDKTFAEAFTFTRGTTATARNATGGITDVAIDEQRLVGNREGLLIEQERTNLLTYSEEFDNAAWGGILTITPNDSTAPDGTTTADKAVASTSNELQSLTVTNITVVNGKEYALSFFAKPAGYDFAFIDFRGAGGAFGNDFAYFDLSLGVVSSTEAGITSAKIEGPYSDGSYRCSATAVSQSTNGAVSIGPANADGGGTFTGDGTSGIHIWGAQLEQGSHPTSYIPTTGTQVTRVADDVFIPGSVNPLTETQGTIYLEGVADFGPGGDSNIFRINATSTNYIRISIDGTGSRESQVLVLYRNSTQSGVSSGTSSVPPGSRYKVAFSYNDLTKDINLAVNGTIYGPFSYTQDVPSVVGEDIVLNTVNNILSDLQLFPEALSESELITLTGGTP